MGEFIDISKSDKVTTITMNRPDVMNCINAAMHAELQAALDEFAADDAQKICVLTGAGDRAFCAGSDLKDAALQTPYPADGYAGLIRRYDLNKPVIAAVNGFALGGGFEIALACDIIIAARGAKFGLPEPLVGAVALGGGLHRLPRQIGLKQAMGMILTAKPVSADEGYRMGFVNEVVDAEGLPAKLREYCGAILAGAPAAIRASKETVMRGLDEDSLAAALEAQDEFPAFKEWRESADATEGPTAFAEKRTPNWTT